MTRVMDLTVTQKLRLFLCRSGQAVAPWSSVEEVMDRLYALLYQRREQAGLWEDLAALLDSIQSDAREMLAAPDAEILSQSRVNALVAELRRAMRASAEAPAAGAMRRFSVGKSASVLACIALLAAGFSLGCGSSNSQTNGGSDAATPPLADGAPTAVADVAPSPTPDAATTESTDLAPSPAPDAAMTGSTDLAPSPTPDAATTGSTDAAPSPAPDAALSEAGDATARPADATNDGSADSSSGDTLMDLFRDGSPEDIAAKLEASVADTPADRKTDKPMVVYKGVTFPA